MRTLLTPQTFIRATGTKFSLHLSQPVTTVLNRARFDQYLAGQAEAAGARFVLDSRVQSLIKAMDLLKE